VQNEAIGITLFATQTGNDVEVKYTASNTGIDGSITFSVSKFLI
jgi:hypothetical protein